MRKVILYGGVTALLIIGLVLGIVWAKQRSSIVATSHEPSKQVGVADEKPTPSSNEPGQTQQQAQTPPTQPSPQPTPQHPAQVPATGATSVAASLVGYIAVALAISWYMHTRKRLFTIR